MMRIIQQQDALRLYSLGDISMATLNQTFEVRSLGVGSKRGFILTVLSVSNSSTLPKQVLTESQMAELLGSSQRVDRRRAMAGALSAADLAVDVMQRKDVVSEVSYVCQSR